MEVCSELEKQTYENAIQITVLMRLACVYENMYYDVLRRM